jgi:hypothetical protein
MLRASGKLGLEPRLASHPGFRPGAWGDWFRPTWLLSLFFIHLGLGAFPALPGSQKTDPTTWDRAGHTWSQGE